MNFKTYSPHLSPFPHSHVSCKSLHNLSLSILTAANCCSDISVVLIPRHCVVENILGVLSWEAKQFEMTSIDGRELRAIRRRLEFIIGRYG